MSSKTTRKPQLLSKLSRTAYQSIYTTANESTGSWVVRELEDSNYLQALRRIQDCVRRRNPDVFSLKKRVPSVDLRQAQNILSVLTDAAFTALHGLAALNQTINDLGEHVTENENEVLAIVEQYIGREFSQFSTDNTNPQL